MNGDFVQHVNHAVPQVGALLGVFGVPGAPAGPPGGFPPGLPPGLAAGPLIGPLPVPPVCAIQGGT